MPSQFVQRCVSTLYSINKSDLIRGLKTAVSGAVVATLGTTISTGGVPTKAELILAGKAALVAGISYLGVKFFSGPKPAQTLTGS